MIRETLAAGLVLALVVSVPALAQAAPAPDYWYTVINTSVEQGVPFLVQVYGPPNGTFGVALYSQPFNDSPAVFSAVYLLPGFATLANGSAVGQVQVNTSLLGLEPFLLRLTVANGSDIAAPTILQVQPPGDTVTQTKIQTLQYDMAENFSRIMAIGEEQGREKGYYLASIVAAVASSARCILVVAVTRTSLAERKLAQRVRNPFGVFTRGDSSWEATGFWSPERPGVRPNAEAIFVCTKTNPRDCNNECLVPQLRSRLVDHLIVRHHVPPERVDEMISTDPAATKRVREHLREEGMSSARERTRRERRSKPVEAVDLSDIAGRRS